MIFRIDGEILEKFPDLNIGLVVAKGIDNTGSSEDVINMIREMENETRKNFDVGTLSQNPKIEAWRKAYSSFGAKPKKYKCSVENLYRMILGGIELRHINTIVDIYNYVSIKHMVPVGGDDLDKVDGDITLKLAQGNEPFRELNSEEVKNPKEGEVVYADGKEILCRRWNWRECDKTKMTEGTKNVLLVTEGLSPVTMEDIEKVTKELEGLVLKFCGGETQRHVMNREVREVLIS